MAAPFQSGSAALLPHGAGTYWSSKQLVLALLLTVQPRPNQTPLPASSLGHGLQRYIKLVYKEHHFDRNEQLTAGVDPRYSEARPGRLELPTS